MLAPRGTPIRSAWGWPARAPVARGRDVPRRRTAPRRRPDRRWRTREHRPPRTPAGDHRPAPPRAIESGRSFTSGTSTSGISRTLGSHVLPPARCGPTSQRMPSAMHATGWYPAGWRGEVVCAAHSAAHTRAQATTIRAWRTQVREPLPVAIEQCWLMARDLDLVLGGPGPVLPGLPNIVSLGQAAHPERRPGRNRRPGPPGLTIASGRPQSVHL